MCSIAFVCLLHAALSALMSTSYASAADGPAPGPRLTPCPGNNCTTNVCQSQGLDCCQCQQSSTNSRIQVCKCCPAGYTCCPALTASSESRCCPSRTSTCGRTGGCPSTVTVQAVTSQLTCSQCDPMMLSITCDDVINDVFIDGVSYTSSLTPPNGWGHVRTFEIPADTRAIAVNCSDSVGVTAGVLASVTNDYIVTDTTWKCSTQAANGWTLPTFNDAQWPTAVVSGINGPTDVHQSLPGISSSAKWIWTANFNRVPIDSPVYCRGRFPANGCGYNYGNCTNLCAQQSGQCCNCDMVGFGPTKVCSCCPTGYTCCGRSVSGSLPLCCPTGYGCRTDGTCLQQVEYRPVAAQFTCGACTP